ncbi:hypothetical protein HHI36_024024 [Cryptolaemus montrouzieri]|uniref:Uncharacterized protein n=1 Tax=Cryptolaemus montrouzieri TaxID=559131 RepID=A0ABD2N7F8_9CUCU
MYRSCNVRRGLFCFGCGLQGVTEIKPQGCSKKLELGSESGRRGWSYRSTMGTRQEEKSTICRNYKIVNEPKIALPEWHSWLAEILRFYVLTSLSTKLRSTTNMTSGSRKILRRDNNLSLCAINIGSFPISGIPVPNAGPVLSSKHNESRYLEIREGRKSILGLIDSGSLTILKP